MPFSATTPCFLNTCRAGDSTASLGSLCHCITTLSQEILLNTQPDPPQCSLRLLPLVSSSALSLQGGIFINTGNFGAIPSISMSLLIGSTSHKNTSCLSTAWSREQRAGFRDFTPQMPRPEDPKGKFLHSYGWGSLETSAVVKEITLACLTLRMLFHSFDFCGIWGCGSVNQDLCLHIKTSSPHRNMHLLWQNLRQRRRQYNWLFLWQLSIWISVCASSW